MQGSYRAGHAPGPAGSAPTPPFPLLPKAVAKKRPKESYVTYFIIRTLKNSCEASARPGVQSHSGIYLAVRGLRPPTGLKAVLSRGAGFPHWVGLV